MEPEVALSLPDLFLRCVPEQLLKLGLECLILAFLLVLVEVLREVHEETVEIFLGWFIGFDEETPKGDHQLLGGSAVAGRLEGNVTFQSGNQVLLKIMENRCLLAIPISALTAR